jgi:hypothetical protein
MCRVTHLGGHEHVARLGINLGVEARVANERNHPLLCVVAVHVELLSQEPDGDRVVDTAIPASINHHDCVWNRMRSTQGRKMSELSVVGRADLHIHAHTRAQARTRTHTSTHTHARAHTHTLDASGTNSRLKDEPSGLVHELLLQRVQKVIILQHDRALAQLLLSAVKVKVDIQALEKVRDGVAVLVPDAAVDTWAAAR